MVFGGAAAAAFGKSKASSATPNKEIELDGIHLLKVDVLQEDTQETLSGDGDEEVPIDEGSGTGTFSIMNPVREPVRHPS